MFEELFLKPKSLVRFAMVGFSGHLVLVSFKSTSNFKHYPIK